MRQCFAGKSVCEAEGLLLQLRRFVPPVLPLICVSQNEERPEPEPAYPPVTIPLAGAGAALQAVGDRLNTLQHVRTSELLAAVSTESSLTPEKVVRALLDRDDLVLLAAEAIDAARRSRLPGKAATLGQSLGSVAKAGF